MLEMSYILLEIPVYTFPAHSPNIMIIIMCFLLESVSNIPAHYIMPNTSELMLIVP